MYQSGGEAGTISDVALDPNTGCARFVMIESGGHTIAAPFRILHHGSGDSYTVTVDKERLMSAPVVNIDRVEEWSNPSFVDRVYSYYGESPSETNVSINEREGKGRGAGEYRNERGNEEHGTARNERNRGEGGREAQRNQQRGEGSPAPVGEDNTNRKQNAMPGESPKAQTSPSTSKTRSSHGRAQTSPSNERSTGRTEGNASPSSRESGPANSPSMHKPESAASPRSARGTHTPEREQRGTSRENEAPHSASSPTQNQ